MNGGGWKFDPPPGPTASTKPNRLSRSYRLSQQTQTAGKTDSPTSLQLDFKTPTRIPRPKGGGVFSGESPHNDSDFQQDIIWDSTSPSPNRLGRRGRKQRCGVVDISEIVNRIAPKHGRPEATEPTLQQWIGDSATIPCTPDVQVPKTKKKSPRVDAVDDLLKLAKRFDFNMFHQDVDEEESKRSPELLSVDAVHPDNTDPDTEAETDPQPDPHIDSDLDFLFDESTQHVSGALSQAPSASSCCSSATASVKGTLVDDAFENDWDDDDFLDDSLVLEMTQNPHKFTASKYCSTQKVSGAVRQSPAARMRQTFKLESNPNFSIGRIQNGSESQQNRLSSGHRAPVKAGSQWTRSERQDPFHQRLSVKSNTTVSAKASAPEPLRNFSFRPETPAASDLADDDLLAFFLSDPVWDDPVDDSLLCELCEDLENQIQNTEPVPTNQTVRNQRAVLQPANWNPPHCAGSSLASEFVSSVTVAPTGSSRASGCVQGRSRVQVGHAHKDQFMFEKPSKAPKCSAAEIELKKRQAIERRRQRLQAAQNLRGPT